jgi:hypothetical protein
MTAGKDRHFSTTPTPSPATFDVGDRVMHYGEGPLEVIEVKEGWLRVADTATVKHRWLSMAGKGTTRVAPSSCPEPRETQWGWATSDAPERWDGGFATREDVIAEAAGCLGPNEPFWIMNGTSLDAGSFVPSVDWIVEHMNASACDEAGEAAEEWPQCELSNEAEAELKALLEGWARKHAPAKFWAADGTAERVDPAAQFTRKDSEK